MSFAAGWIDNGACDGGGATPTTAPRARATATTPPRSRATATTAPRATATTAPGTGCWSGWSSGTAYSTNAQVSRTCGAGTQNYQAAYWTQGNDPCSNSGGAGSGEEWIPKGACGGGGGSTPTSAPRATATAAPRATATSAPRARATATSGGGTGIGSIVSQSQFDTIWPPSSRAATYTYADFKSAADQYYPGLCGTGDTNTRKRECAAYFASKSQETGQGRYDRELYCQPGGGGAGSAACNYCSGSTPCGGCAAGQQYWGRHAVQLSWDYNYCSAGGQISVNLHADPNAIFNNKITGWRLSDWYWMTQLGPNVSNGYGQWPSESAHDAITTTDPSGNYGFGGTTRSVNGGIECGSRVQQQINRVTYYNGTGGADDEDGSGGTLGVLGYGGGPFGRRFCSP